MRGSPYLPKTPYASLPGRASASEADASGDRGGVLACGRCGYVFVGKHASSAEASCERCGNDDVTRWKPSN